MSIADTDDRLLDMPYEGFVNDLLQLYSSPQVTVRIGSTGSEYKLPKALLCEQSAYFKATFEGGFREGEKQSTILTEVDGVVSTRSFQLLVQWLYLGRVILGEVEPGEAITTIIEFIRLADMCGVTGMESLMARHIKDILKANPDPRANSYSTHPDTNTYCLTSQHIISASHLPRGHAVRSILAAAVVDGYLRYDNHKFLKETQEVLNFSADVLKSVRITLKSLKHGQYSSTFKDPIRDTKVVLEEFIPRDSAPSDSSD